MQQFQNYILNDAKDQVEQTTLDKLKFYDIPANVPQSVFISEARKLHAKNSENTSIMEAKTISCGLYDKYVENDTVMEINISSELRGELKGLLADKQALMELENVNLDDLLLLWEKPKQEMLTLLDYSFSRFKTKSEYKTVVEMVTDGINKGHTRQSTISKKRISLSIEIPKMNDYRSF